MKVSKADLKRQTNVVHDENRSSQETIVRKEKKQVPLRIMNETRNNVAEWIINATEVAR